MKQYQYDSPPPRMPPDEIPPSTLIREPSWGTKYQAPAPKVMMPAGGAVPKWGHCRGGIMSGPPPLARFETAPFSPEPNGRTTHPPHPLLKRQTRAYTRKYQRADPLGLYAPAPPRNPWHCVACPTSVHQISLPWDRRGDSVNATFFDGCR